MSNVTVYIVSEDPAVSELLERLVVAEGFNSEQLLSLEAWLGTAEQEPASCLVLDVSAGNAANLGWLDEVCARISVLVLIGRGDIPMAVHAIRQGAAYVLQIPCSDEKLLDHIKWVLTSKPGDPATR